MRGGIKFSVGAARFFSFTSPIKVQAFCIAESIQPGPIHDLLQSAPSNFCSKFISNDILFVDEKTKPSPFSGIFIFSAGCIVTWQLEKLHIDTLKALISLISPYQQEKIYFSSQGEDKKVDTQLHRSIARSSFLPSSSLLSLLKCTPMEADEISLVFSAKNNKDHHDPSSDPGGRINEDIITIPTCVNSEASIDEIDESLIKEKVAISYALARSVRIGFLEHLLNDYLIECKHRDLAMRLALSGSFDNMDRRDALKALGQMIYCRGQLNLYHSRLQLTDTSPDLFWDSSSLLAIYYKISSYLESPSRISQLNKKMDYATEITGLLRTTLVENHSHFLEIMIIALICIEVGFECFHYFLLFKHPQVLGIH